MTQWGLDTLFNPAKRHMDEEKRRLQSTREEAGDSSGGKRIDFEAGKVTIRRARTASENGETPTDPDPDTDGPATAGAAAADEPTTTAPPAVSAAAIRAAKRRGRTPR